MTAPETTTTSDKDDEETARPEATHNFKALVGDVTCFFVGMAFLDTTTVLPALVTHLGGGPAILGLVAALRQGAYFLPQLLVAHHLQSRIHRRPGADTRFLPFILRVCFWGRIWLFPAALGVLLFGRVAPSVALGLLIAAYMFSWLGDGAGSVPWTAIVGRAIPARRRGRLFATTQVLGGVGRIGVGLLVARILSDRWQVPFPVKASLIVLGCAIFMALSWGFLALIREPTPTRDEAREQPNISLGAYLRELPARLRARPDFARLALAQILGTAVGAASPFYLGFAEKSVPGGLPDTIVGTFLIVQTAGLLLCAPTWGWLNDRKGPRAALICLFGASLLAPLAAGLAGRLGGSLPLYCAAYFCLGAVQDGWVTFTNYLLEAVPADEQPTYIALMNAASAPSLLLPLIVGLIVRSSSGSGSASPALWFQAALLLAGLYMALTLPDTRRRRKATVSG